MSEADYLVGVEEYELAFVEDVLDDAPVDAQTVYKETIDMSERAIAAEAAYRTTTSGGGGGSLTGAVILAPASSARNVIQPTAGAVIAAVVKAHATQSVDLTRWTSSADAVWAAFDSVGTLNLSPTAGQPGLVINRGDLEAVDIVRVFAGTRLIFDMYQWNLGGDKVTEFDIGDDVLTSDKMLFQSNRHMLLKDAAGAAGNVFEIKSISGVRSFGIFAATAVSQQAASDVGALWTALKNYGWLTSGSTAPDLAPQAELDAHTGGASDVHDASAISFSPTGTVAATDVQAAIAEVASEAAGGGISATIVDAKGDLIAATAADTVARLATGANGKALIAASGETAGLKYVYPPSYEYARVERTSNITSTATTAAGATTILTLASITFDGSTTVLLEFDARGLFHSAAVATLVNLWEDSTDLGVLARSTGATISVHNAILITPTAGAKVYTARLWGVSAGTAEAEADATRPMFLRAVQL